MNTKTLILLSLSAALFTAPACATGTPQNDENAGIPNPASVYCEQSGGTLDLWSDDDGGVEGICIFPDGSECEEWAYFRGECAPASADAESQTAEEAPRPPATDPHEPALSSPDEYEGWWIYQNNEYSFSIMLPEDWIVEETDTSDPLMSGHFFSLHPQNGSEIDLNLRLSVRRMGEETLLWPTGVGAGEFVPMGTMEAAGQVVSRIGFKCPDGGISEIWYHGPEETGPNIRIGELEFGFIFRVSGDPCREGTAIDEKLGHLSDMIIESLKA